MHERSRLAAALSALPLALLPFLPLSVLAQPLPLEPGEIVETRDDAIWSWHPDGSGWVAERRYAAQGESLDAFAGACSGRDPEAGGAALLMARTVAHLLVHPEPYLPFVVRACAELLAWLAMVAALVVRPGTRVMSAAVALALLAGGGLDAPLGAVSLAVAALALARHPGLDLRDLGKLQPAADEQTPARD